jgi:hypothetical protein
MSKGATNQQKARSGLFGLGMLFPISAFKLIGSSAFAGF